MENKYNLTLEQNIFLAKRNLVDNVYANAKMEGINVTFPETKTILEGVNVPNLKINEIQCILNLRDAWKYLINNIEAEFDLSFICKINEQVARNESLEWGKLRTRESTNNRNNLHTNYTRAKRSRNKNKRNNEYRKRNRKSNRIHAIRNESPTILGRKQKNKHNLCKQNNDTKRSRHNKSPRHKTTRI